NLFIRVVEDDKPAGAHFVDMLLYRLQIEGDETIDEIGHSVVHALARANHVVGVAASNTRREVLVRVDFPPHMFQDAGDQIAGGETAVSRLPSEHHFDVVEDHPSLRAAAPLESAPFHSSYRVKFGFLFQAWTSTTVTVMSPTGR